jgi:hypothetical protein
LINNQVEESESLNNEMVTEVAVSEYNTVSQVGVVKVMRAVVTPQTDRTKIVVGGVGGVANKGASFITKNLSQNSHRSEFTQQAKKTSARIVAAPSETSH